MPESTPAPPSRAYWLCQLAGWGGYLVFTLWQGTALADFSWARALTETSLAATMGVALTHGARRVIRRRGWLRLSALALAPRVIGASLVLAVVHVAVLAVVELGFYGDQPPNVGLMVLFALLRWSEVFFIWLALYCGYGLLEERHRMALARLQSEQAQQTAELRALKAQLNPHFLFNALNSVRALIADDPDRAQTAVTRLAQLLRYTLNAEHEEVVTVAQELEIVRHYLGLEGLRLDQRLQTELEIADDAQSARIPTMLLQTLVENAIKHGVAHLPEGGTLRVAVALRNGGLALEVENPRPPGPTSASEPGGVGLANAAERLKLLFGPAARLELDLSLPGSAVARAWIPQ